MRTLGLTDESLSVSHVSTEQKQNLPLPGPQVVGYPRELDTAPQVDTESTSLVVE